MNMLMQSLGLDKVDGDPNKIPDGRYDGEIINSQYSFVASKAQISHVLTYKVTSGDKNGAQKQEWFTIMGDCKDENGNVPEKLSDVKACTPVMSEDQKVWYKKRLLDLGVDEQSIPTLDVATLKGVQVTFGVKTNDAGFQNVGFASQRKGATAGTPSAVSLADLGAAPATLPEAQAATPTPAAQPATEAVPTGLTPQPVAEVAPQVSVNPQPSVVAGL